MDPNPIPSPSPNPNPNPNPSPSLNPYLYMAPTSSHNPNSVTGTAGPSSSSPNSQQRVNRGIPAELQMAHDDAWRVCHPDFKTPFSSLEDACERLLPYHVVADYEAEEEDKMLESDSTGQVLSRSQQWDNNMAAKLAEFTATFENQVRTFNTISRKRGVGEFRNEERLMIEQLLLQEERRALLETRAEIDSRQKAGRESHESNLLMEAMVHPRQFQADVPALGDVLNSSGQRDVKEPSDGFLINKETD